MAPTRTKFNARKTKVDGLTFDSLREAERWVALCEEQSRGVISGLKRQARFKLEVNGQLITHYVADFIYDRDEERVVEDVKGYITDVYRIKRRLMKACYGIEILETR